MLLCVSLSFPSRPVPTGPPQGLAVADHTTTSITLTWSDPAPDRINDRDGATGFEVRRNGQRVTTVTDRTYTFTGLTVATSYDFEILAINDQGTAPDNHAAELTTSTASGGMQTLQIEYILHTSTWRYAIYTMQTLLYIKFNFCHPFLWAFLLIEQHNILSVIPVCSPQCPNPASGPPQVLYHLPGVEGPRALCW